MSTPRILMVYGTRYGQTARIASHISDLLAGRHFAVTMYRGSELPSTCDPAEYDGVMIGASMIIGHYQRSVRDFVAQHVRDLNRIPSAFFAVSGAAGSANVGERQEAQRRMDALFAKTGWHPALRISVAGAIAYTKYNLILRWMMRRISRKEGRSTDTSRDHEYTNWVQVEQFADRFADRMDEWVRRPPRGRKAGRARVEPELAESAPQNSPGAGAGAPAPRCVRAGRRRVSPIDPGTR
jgi:menaquinone-dependent protoporphyrinogen oxidase